MDLQECKRKNIGYKILKSVEKIRSTKKKIIILTAKGYSIKRIVKKDELSFLHYYNFGLRKYRMIGNSVYYYIGHNIRINKLTFTATIDNLKIPTKVEERKIKLKEIFNEP